MWVPKEYIQLKASGQDPKDYTVVDKNGDFYIDVFSCKEYDIQKVIKFVNNYFEPKSIKDTYLLRQS